MDYVSIVVAHLKACLQKNVQFAIKKKIINLHKY